MSRIRGMWTQLRSLLRPSGAERDIDDELRLHLDMETRAGIATGLTAPDARRAARIKLGGVERYKDEARDARGATPLLDARADLRHGWRVLRAHPGFAAAVVLTLALGIGANTAIFSVVDAVLLQRSPFPEPDRLVMLWETDRASGTRHEPSSWPDVLDFRARSRTLSAIGSVMGQDITLSTSESAERVTGLAITPNVLPLLGVRPLAGRLFDSTDSFSGAAPVVALSETFWRMRFNADPRVIGQTVSIDERAATVIGVVPTDADLGILQVHQRADYAPTFSGARVQVWLPIRPTAQEFPRSTHPFLTVARLAPGVSLPVAQAELSAIASDLERTYGDVNANRGVNLELYSEVVFARVRTGLYVLLGAVLLVLLVTCANVANLLLARSVSRSREVALRLALGASLGRIRRQFIVESALLVALGTAAGVALAFAGLRVLIGMAPSDIPRIGEAAVNIRVLGYTAVLAAGAAFFVGLLPAIRSSRVDLHETLKAQSNRRASEGRGGRRLRSMLIVAEVALAVMLVNGAGLLLRSFWRLQSVNPGFDAAQVLKAQYQLPPGRYPRDFSRWPDIPEINSFHARLQASVGALPGVRSVAIAGGSPLDAGFTNSFSIAGRESEQHPEIRTRFMSPGYLATLGVPLLAGRDLGAGDDAKAPAVVLINKAGADRYFPNASPIGHQIGFWGVSRRIVGVIGDEHFRGVDAPTEPAVYAPLAQAPAQSATLMVRTSGDPMSVLPAVWRTLHDMDPQVPLFDIEPLSATLSGSIATQRFSMILMTLFGLVAIGLAIVGVHGVLSYTVTQRVPEMGIRVALGASRSRIMGDVLREGLGLTAVGVGIGLVISAAGSRVLASLVFGISTTDFLTFATVTLAVLATAGLATLFPALRATRVDPIDALRTD